MDYCNAQSTLEAEDTRSCLISNTQFRLAVGKERTQRLTRGVRSLAALGDRDASASLRTDGGGLLLLLLLLLPEA